MIIEYISPRILGFGRVQRQVQKFEIISIILDLLESWISDPKLNCEIDNEFIFFVPFLKEFENNIKEKFASFLIKFIKMKKYEYLSFYSYIIEYLVNENLKAEFKENIPDNAEVPGIETFIKAEEHMARKKFNEALNAYNQIPDNFPKNDGIHFEKLYRLSKELNDYFLMGKCLRNLIKIHESFTRYASNQFQDITLKNIIKGYLDDLSKASDYIIMEKGIPCRFCSIYISPNTQFCPKCGEPNK